MMRLCTWTSFLTVALFLSCSSRNSPPLTPEGPSSSSDTAGRNDAQLSEDQYLRLSRAVFEVVVPRLEDDDIVYEEKLPEHLLPFKLRKSPFRGIGTAFALGPNRFVSAAHVFDLHRVSQVNPLYLRDQEGKVFEVHQVLRYSQHRDLIEFSVKKAPSDVIPLSVGAAPRMGSYVFTVGNAMGDGIVTRSGYITSFTPEPVNGNWNDIRYSAPASPGNSGGPLLNKNLEVVGIVVRRTESENLNFAVPIAELEKTTGAEYFLQEVKLEQYNKRLSRDWKFTVKLPKGPVELSKLAAADFISFQNKLFNDFQEKFKLDVFPSDPSLKSWARDSFAINLAGFIQKDNNDKWYTSTVDWSIQRLEGYRSIVLEKAAQKGNSALFILERPEKMSLKDFFSDGAGILETYMKQVGWARNYAGRRILIKSFGKPESSERWNDRFGRRWITWEWNTKFDDRSLQLNCLPIPAGVFCVMDSDPYRNRELSRLAIRRAADRLMVDIYGKIRDWKEWKALPEEWKQPAIPKNVEIVLKAGASKTVVWKAGRFSGTVHGKEFDEDTEMSLSFNSEANNIFKLRLRNVQIADKDGDIQVGAGWNLKPDEKGHPSYRDVWTKMVAGRAPYNGEAQLQGKHSLIVKLLEVPSTRKEDEIFFATCGVLTSMGDSRIKEVCGDFSAAVKLDSTAPGG